LPFAAQINDVAPCANDVLRNDVMLCINEVALRANGKSTTVQAQTKSGENIFFIKGVAVFVIIWYNILIQ